MNNIEEKKSVIVCPICGKGKFVAVENPSGKTSENCYKCQRLLGLCWNKMTAKLAKPIKGAYKLAANI